MEHGALEAFYFDPGTGRLSRKLLAGLTIRSRWPPTLRLLAHGSWSRVSCRGGVVFFGPARLPQVFLPAVSRQA